MRSRPAIRAAVPWLPAIALVAAAACTSATTAPSNATAPADQPVRPKVNRVVIAAPPPAVEANLYNTAGTNGFQLRPVYEYLIGVAAADGRDTPQLAESWALEPDGRSWRFKLRSGVQFHGGFGDFTAGDVEASYKAMADQQSTATYAGYLRDAAERLDVVNDREIVVGMKKPDSDFLNTIGELAGGLPITSKQQLGKVNPYTLSLSDSPLVGTAPYQFQGRQQGAYVRFERAPFRQWRAQPDFPEVEMRWQNEASTRLAALLTGEVHITPLARDLQEVGESKGMKVIQATSPAQRTFFSFYCCYLNDRNDASKGYTYPDSPLLDVRVRRALNKAIDRDALNKAFFRGKAEVMTMHPFRPEWAGWNPDWQRRFAEEYGYDPERAKALLAEAGYGGGRALQTNILMVKLPDLPEADDLQEAVAGYWRNIGVDVQLVNLDRTQLADRRGKLAFNNHAVLISTSSDQSTAFWVYNSGTFSSRGGAWEDPEQDAIFTKIRNEPDPQKRDGMWRDLGNLAFGRFHKVPLFWWKTEAVVNPQVVRDYQFPGSITGTWTHLENIKAVPQ